ncbi:MAG TPA: Gfo/Idh/MocA family oxidoreductase [Edaphocola sp.]|nr:Gfo/Idh/MocA family oxidoreductase [Edaphocola sp.]
MDKKSIKFVVIGCGHIGKRHAAMILANPEAELVALVDIKSKEELGLTSFVVPFFNSIDELLSSNLEYDVVNIAVPNGIHAQVANLFIENYKSVVIEKPMTLSSVDAEELIQKAKEKEVSLFVVMQNRYSPPSQWLKQIVDSGKLGQIYMIQMNCFWNRDERYYDGKGWHGKKDLDGGVLFTQFSHFIDILYWVFGEIYNIKSTLKDFNHQNLTDFEDSGIVTFELEHGALGNLNFSTSVWDQNLESSMTIIAENGSIKIGGQYMDKVAYCHIKDYKIPVLGITSPGNDYGIYKGSAANHQFVIENVVDVLLRGETITTTGEEGLKVVKIIEKMYNFKRI